MARHLSRRWSDLRQSRSTLHSLIKPERRSKLETLFEGSGKSSPAAGATEEVAVITSEMTRVDVRSGEHWRWMVAIKMSKAPVVVAETESTLSRGNPLG